jgi:hypothetical protein
VARGKHHPADGALVARDRPAERRRGHVAVGEDDVQAVRGEDLGSRLGERACLEAGVVADEDAPAGVVLGEDPTGRVGDATQ